MSFDASMAALTAALNANTAAIEKNTALLQGALNKNASGGKAMTAAEAENVKAPAAATETKAADAGKKTDKKADKKADKKPEPAKVTIDTLRDTAGAFLSVKDKAEKDARKAFVGTLVEHFGVERVTELPEENWGQAIAWLNARTADADFEIPPGDDSSNNDDDEDGSLI